MKAVLDAGAFVAIDKQDRRIGAMLRVLHRQRIPLWTSAAVLAQIWRNGARQASLARVLAGVGVRALGPTDGKHAGELQGSTRTDDVVDAHVALMVDPGDIVITSDPDDIGRPRPPSLPIYPTGTTTPSEEIERHQLIIAPRAMYSKTCKSIGISDETQTAPWLAEAI